MQESGTGIQEKASLSGNGVSLGIVQAAKIYPYRQMIYTQTKQRFWNSLEVLKKRLEELKIKGPDSITTENGLNILKNLGDFLSLRLQRKPLVTIRGKKKNSKIIIIIIKIDDTPSRKTTE